VQLLVRGDRDDGVYISVKLRWHRAIIRRPHTEGFFCVGIFCLKREEIMKRRDKGWQISD